MSSLLSPERAALCEPSLATGGLAQDLRAALADDDCLCVREDGGDGEAAGALHVHEEGARGGHEGLPCVISEDVPCIESIEDVVPSACACGPRPAGWG